MKCLLCGLESRLISRGLQLCNKCIKENLEALPVVEKAHLISRSAFNLPSRPPKETGGVSCRFCVNECIIPENQRGYCGVRLNKGGRLTGVSSNEANVMWYYDPLPTNCVADWVCPGGVGAGYPQFAYRNGHETGFKNLAVFFNACTFNCLFCQNWHFREEQRGERKRKVEELVDAVSAKVSCICYFGGDPTPQLHFAIKASKLALQQNKERILRICWESNGSMNPALLKGMINLSLQSGGCIKFDLKAWNETLHKALTGVTNRRTLENFKLVAERIKDRPEPPLLIASTLLVPGYVDEEEVRNIARFIASINPEIPYTLLAFYPHFYMSDLPTTSKTHAYQCLEAAKAEGLKRVRLGNVHLLSG